MTRFPEEISHLAETVIATLVAKNASIVTAESCTGGLIAGALTSVSGSSAVVYGGFVTYSNAAKMKMIGVGEKTLSINGAVSEPVAREMAYGAHEVADTSFSVAVTGIAGPTGGTPEKPVGLVHFAVAGPVDVVHKRVEFSDLGRERIREESVKLALQMVLEAVQAFE